MSFLKIKALIVAAVLFAASSAFASFEFNVTVNTSSLAGSTDYLYMQYIPVDGVASTAHVYGFVTDGTLGAQSLNVVNGSAVTGTLPGTVNFANSNGINDYNHAITLGNSLSFLVSFDSIPGGVVGGTSTFSLGLFADELGTIAALNTAGVNGSVPGTVVTIDLANNGTTTAVALDPSTTAAPTPIPAAAWLLGSGLMGLVGVRRRKQ